MSVAAVSSPNLQAPEPPVSQRRAEDVAGRQLMQALESGDLSTAQQAYDTLAAFGPNNSGPFSSPTQAAEFQSLGQAIQSGDLATALQDASTIGQQQLTSDVTVVKHDLQSGDSAGAQQAMTNLSGDFWAMYGWWPQDPGQAGGSSASGTATNSGGTVNTQA